MNNTVTDINNIIPGQIVRVRSRQYLVEPTFRTLICSTYTSIISSIEA
ncbi:hypothetical protein [Sphaerospermopsis sp. LEGE 08334]|nr:hypothetical protein [Sphaerospermopsis sp. LEGE 08334]MBE9059208.1 hypothetical protein [Sphaerospermopsis sp. LEGE 08334]